MRALLALLVSLLVAAPACAQQVKISQMPNGGTIQQTDLIPVVRGGSNYSVYPGFLSTLGIGSGLTYSGGLLNTIPYSNFTSSAAGLVPASGGGTTNFLRADGSWAAPSGGGGGGSGSGTVTSVTFTGDGIFLSNTPSAAVTSSGTVAASVKSQSANQFLAGPTTGSAATPTFRSIVANDIPTLNQNTTGTAATVTGIVAVTNGGTNATTGGAAIENLTTPTTNGVVLSDRTAANTYTTTTLPNILGSCSLLEDYPNFTSDGEAQAGTDFQNWLLSCQRKAIKLGATGFASVTRPACIEAFSPPTNPYGQSFNTPIVIPRYVCWHPTGMYVRDGSSGTITSNWTGSTTTSALANLYEPNFIFAPASALTGHLHTILNSIGTDAGSGPVVGRTWRIKTITIDSNNQGTGFNGGESCTVATGDTKSPSQGATFTVATASSGHAASITYAPTQWAQQTGAYFLPPAQQVIQWTAANGWNGSNSYQPTVFAGDGAYLTSCTGSGSPSGLAVNVTWWPDWCDGTNGCSASTIYDGYYGLQTSATTYIDTIYAQQSAALTSATYGHTWGFAHFGFDTDINYIQTEGSYWGMLMMNSDLRVLRANDVNSFIGLKIATLGSGHIWHYTGDTSLDHFIEIDRASDVTLDADLFSTSGSTPTTSVATVVVGGDSNFGSGSSNESYGNLITINASNAGTTTGVPVIDCKYTRSTIFRVNGANLGQSGSALSYKNTGIANLNTNCEASNVFEGQIDNVSGSIFSGTDLGVRRNVYQSANKIVVDSTTPTVSSGFGTSPVITGQASSFQINVGTGGSASTGVVALGLTAPHGWSCSANDVTTPASNNTVQTGSSTTTATFTNYVRTTGVAGAWTASDTVEVSCKPN